MMAEATPTVRVLDDGFVRLVEAWGSDAKIAESARVSYSSAKSRSADDALVRSLVRRGHSSPFGHAGMTIHVRTPIFVARQWMKHDAFHEYNEISGRYSVMPYGAWIPPNGDVRKQSESDRQGTGATFDEGVQGDLRMAFLVAARESRARYEDLIAAGVERGQARAVLPLGQYTEFWTSGSLRGWIHFLEMREADDAQAEIRAYAVAVGEIFRNLYPVTYRAVLDFVLNRRVVSGPDWEILSRHVNWEAFYAEVAAGDRPVSRRKAFNEGVKLKG
jgi:thymidylate synthase (FAD)